MKVSLLNFNAVADGRYNAGEVVLGKDGRLGVVNNHVNMKFLNNKVVDKQTVLKTKEAFIQAIADLRVDVDVIAKIRKELGLPSENVNSNDFRTLDLRPLTRLQVRDILDKYHFALVEKVTSHNHLTLFRTTEFNKQQEKYDAMQKEWSKARDKDSAYKAGWKKVNAMDDKFKATVASRTKFAAATNDASIMQRTKGHRKMAEKILKTDAVKLINREDINPNLYKTMALYLLLTNPGTVSPEKLLEEAEVQTRKIGSFNNENIPDDIDPSLEKLFRLNMYWGMGGTRTLQDLCDFVANGFAETK